MDLFDLLDRENARLVADFDDCLPMADDGASWGDAAQALLGRMATYTLVVEQVLQPALLALRFDSIDALNRTHERLRRVVAEALLSVRGPRPVAEKAMRATRQVLARYRHRMRREFYPQLYRLLSTSEAFMLSDDMLQWLDRHCRHMTTGTRAVDGIGLGIALDHGGRSRWAAGGRRIDKSRLPTLHHVVPRDMSAGSRLSRGLHE